ncbi:F-box/FBD/LRR-repeat protein At5g56420-like [Trifolium pratense]|uniref:F-box/FBD/LRR-repeat protein At5g56420-like n=1 Tax=Trifolium pratense TaxID=57577 RepID=UPI001E697F5E|nr:F-box/FBD/LRR-repeat protein At5g56420-like [Trifolium pratense]
MSTVDQFCCFVDNIMLSPLSTKQPLKKFSLFLTVETESSLFNFNAWVEAATRRGVEELRIYLSRRTFKPTIFISQTLVVVKLHSLRIGTDTSSVHLPSLKTLHLSCVNFTNQNDFINFLSACPNVDDFKVVGPIFHMLVKASSGPIFAKLVKASIGPIYAKFIKLIEATTAAMFNGIRNVQFLRVGIVTEASFKVIPVFSNLIHIEIVFYSHRPSHWDDVVDVLQHCPKLKILFIKVCCIVPFIFGYIGANGV